ncbi:MAG: cell envelope integrity EipB family protein [Hyphomicrobium sp.]
MNHRALAIAALALAPFLLTSVEIASAGPNGPPVQLAPHRAVYDIALNRTTPGSGVDDMTGRLVYEISGSPCEGYTQTMRFVTRTINKDGEASVTDLRTSSWEDVPARRLRFSTTNYQNEAMVEQTQGDARRAESVAPAKVDLAKPAKKTVDLSAGIYFPVQHSIALIEAAQAGKTLFKAELYDGSENGEKVFVTSALIGRQAAPGAIAMPALAGVGDQLSRTPSWPVSISYFKSDNSRADAIPAYEMSYRFHANGVTSKLVIDHGEFAFSGELKELTFLDAAVCAAGKP